MNDFFVPAGYGEYELVEKRSRFIGRVWPVYTQNEAIERINQVRQMHKEATHNVFAYSIKAENAIKVSDDGEPSKTAGLPMLDILRYEELVNVLAVVTRYFGGTLLGTGGLIRAYSGSVKQALALASIKEAKLMYGYRTKIAYHFYDKLEYDLKKQGAIIKEVKFSEEVVICFYIEDKTILERLKNTTNNSIKIKELDSIYL